MAVCGDLVRERAAASLAALGANPSVAPAVALSSAGSFSKALSLKMKETARRTICVEKETSRRESPGSRGDAGMMGESVDRPSPQASRMLPKECGSILPVMALHRSGDAQRDVSVRPHGLSSTR